MAKEFEIKYHLDSAAQLQRVLSDSAIAAFLQTPWAQIPMKTTYFDTPERALSQRHWTLRHRLEGTRHVLCLKTPTLDELARNEFEVEATCPDRAALAQLCRIGAPEELLELAAPERLLAVCGAKFQRQVATVRFPDGSSAAISGDVGILHGTEQTMDFCEMELELNSGSQDAMLEFADKLATAYGLQTEPKSKFARARVLR